MRQHKFKIFKYKIVFSLKITKNIKLDKVNTPHRCNQTNIKKNSSNQKKKKWIKIILILQKIENQQDYLQQLKKKVQSLQLNYLKNWRKYYQRRHP